MHKKISIPPIVTHSGLKILHCRKDSPSSANNPNPPKTLSPLIKFDSPTLQPQISKASTVPILVQIEDETKKTPIRKITFEKFSAKKSIVDKRARSSSQKREHPFKLPNIETDELSLKYKKIRLENQEIQIEILGQFDEIEELHCKGTETKKIVELCFKLIENVFKYRNTIFIKFFFF